jgi:hypothetical protein
MPLCYAIQGCNEERVHFTSSDAFAGATYET